MLMTFRYGVYRMNNITNLLREQKEEFENTFGADIGEYGMEKIQQYQSTAQQQLIDVIIQEVIDMRSEMPHVYSTQEAQNASFDSYQNVITLLEEAKKNVYEK